MSIYHYSSDKIPESHLSWPQVLMDSSSPSQNPTTFFSRLVPKTDNFRVTVGGRGGSMASDGQMVRSADDRDCSERLFEKQLTPSDVGKLNRLVIPKQQAEKYFPLGGDVGSGEKGFLLSFEDETGKPWMFRYSYWNSSQSYVLTKGWSRFVKEKRLDAGDVVMFSRHQADAGRLFIGWRRKHSGVEEGGGAQAVAGRGIFYNPYPNQQVQGCSSSPSCQPECLLPGAAPTSGNSKKLRLFGVNLECQADDCDTSTVPTATHRRCRLQTVAGAAHFTASTTSDTNTIK